MTTVSKWRPDSKKVNAYKTAAENPNTRKSTMTRLKLFANLEN